MLLTVLFAVIFISSYAEKVDCQVEPGEVLFLSPFIKAGLISEAQRLAEVQGISPEVSSYSGFITVNETYNTNLWFWYFPATKNSDTAPVLLWNDGGPGATALNSLFNENGPYKFNNDFELELRNHSWISEFHLIYLDNPAGVGFSFTEDDAGYPTSGQEAAADMYEFLLQFFELFPSLKENDFYNGGVSFGGIYSTSLAHLIHRRNSDEINRPPVKLNLRGILLDSPWLHPVAQVDYGTSLYSVGLIDKRTKEDFNIKRDAMITLINNNQFPEAAEIWVSTLADIVNAGGYLSTYNFVTGSEDTTLLYDFTDYVTTDSFRRSLHVGNRSFVLISPVVQKIMQDKVLYSVKHLLEELLNAYYKVLIFGGNLDISTNVMSINDVIESLVWFGADEFNENAKRTILNVPNKTVAGYLKSSGNFTHALIRNAGHGTGIDQPEVVLELLRGFLSP